MKIQQSEKQMTDRANVKILPPIIPLMTLTLGGAFHALWPTQIMREELAQPFGVFLAIVSILIVAAAVREMKIAKTAFDIRKTTTHLITTGIFGYSRNPTYLSMVTLCFGIALLANSWAILVGSVLAGSGLCLLVIRQEETYLQDKFGEHYGSYRNGVRRWI